jgi:hypothetical protein
MSIARLESRPIGATPARRGPGRPARVPALLLVALVLAAPLLSPAAVRADIGETIILRCTHGQSLSGFSQSAYRQALQELSADTEEYSDCSSLIRQAQLAGAAGTRGAGTGQSAAVPVPIAATPSQQQAIAHAEHAPPAPVKLDGRVIDPGVVHVNIASALSSLPTPLLATLAFLIACLLLVAGGALRNRVRGGRSD